jgi:hypothetical protein
MTQQHPITPPPELVYDWAEDRERLRDPLPLPEYIANCAAQWGADAELEACCEWLQDPDLNVDTYKLRAARRPKPPSLKEQALEALAHILNNSSTQLGANTIRRALEQLDD